MNSNVTRTAAYLIKLKKEQNKIEKAVRELKAKLLPYAKDELIETEDGSIVYVEGSNSSYLDKNKLRVILKQVFKLSDEMVAKILASASVAKIIKPYLKVIVNDV